MQGDTTLGQIVDILLGKVPIHISINKAEDNGFVTHKSLIM